MSTTTATATAAAPSVPSSPPPTMAPSALPGALPPQAAEFPPQAAEFPPSARTLWFSEISLRDLPLVGGKNASLGELSRVAKTLGIRVPKGFAIPAGAFRWYLEVTGLAPRIAAILGPLNAADLEALQRAGAAVRRAILATPLPEALRADILESYRRLGDTGEASGQGPGEAPPDRSPSSLPPAGGGSRAPARAVAVRSSATAEDLPEASFAGAQESYLHVLGEAALLDACHRCFASLYTDRAISYRFEHGFAEKPVALSVGVQEMVNVSEGASGVLFTLDTETGCRDLVLINAVHGLGEPLVQGKVIPDEYLVFKPTLHAAPSAVIRHSPGARDVRTVPAPGGGTREERIPEMLRSAPVLEDRTILKLAKWGCSIEAHYSSLAGIPTPMDIEWAWEGGESEPAILQARPETVHARLSPETRTRAVLEEAGRILVQGTSIGIRIAHGRVRVLHHLSELGTFEKGDILVTEKTDPDWEPVMRIASGIVTERGGRTCHAAIVSRELGVPAIVGARDATRRLSERQAVTVSCAQGATGSVFEGLLKFREEALPGLEARPLRTKIQLNVTDPGAAFRLAQFPADGVGLVREEFLLAGEIGIHPMALLRHEGLNAALRRQIDALTVGYPDKREFFISKLSEGIGQIAAAFYPRPVLLRFSDLKSNEYAHLVGGTAYEESEENPMLGFRGASRYCAPDFREAFALECEAVKRVREAMGLDNLQVMVPFCRTPEEGRGVLREMELSGLRRGGNGLQVWMMCEIPSNVVLAAEFFELFDGFSIGSNDLTQLVLGVDRDSSRLAALFDERNPAVMSMISGFIAAARAAHKPVGICGQAPSDYPEFAQFLVKQGVTSISLEPDAFLSTRRLVAEAEGAL